MIQEPNWLEEIRRNALQKFSQLPLPQEREEEWRYTDLRSFGIEFKSGDSEIAMDGKTDGIFTDLISAARNHPDILRKHLGTAVKITDKFSAFHYANITNGILIYLPDNKTARLNSKITGGGHTIIITGRNSRLDYMEEYAGGGMSTDALEIFAGENSIINIASVQRCNPDAKIFSFKEAVLDKNATVNMIFGSFGGGFHRLKSGTFLGGEGASSEVLCGFKGKNNQHIDFTVNCNHAVPHTRNNIFAKGTVTDASTSVFRGMIKVEKDAQQTDSYLSDHTLILSDNALANSIPGLQIEANDVKASHGATVGQIDEEQLFYLMARGLSRSGAEQLIVSGFFEQLIEKISDAEYKEMFRAAVQ